MDLNFHYAQHQLSIMRAAATTSSVSRTRHLAAAGLCAFRIRNYQLATGASAAEGWLLKMENLDQPAQGVLMTSRPLRTPPAKDPRAQ